MVWAIDLDDGTLINALGNNIKRPKEELTNVTSLVTCFGTGEFKPEL
jgi:chitinase